MVAEAVGTELIMDRILFGDNQFFGVNHMSEEKSFAQAQKFGTNEAIVKVLDDTMAQGINTFMCTTHDRIADICDHMRANPEKYADFEFYPCMPYAYKYANAITELGIGGALKEYTVGKLIGMAARGSKALATKDFSEIMRMLVDAEMSMFRGLKTRVIFIQNITVDLMLGLGVREPFAEFAQHIRDKYDAEPGFQSINLPLLLDVLDECGIKNPIVCSSINKIGFRMCGGIDAYEKVLRERECRPIAMQIFASGAIPPKEAIEYVCNLSEIESIVFGASTSAHIQQSRELIEECDRDRQPMPNA